MNEKIILNNFKMIDKLYIKNKNLFLLVIINPLTPIRMGSPYFTFIYFGAGWPLY